MRKFKTLNILSLALIIFCVALSACGDSESQISSRVNNDASLSMPASNSDTLNTETIDNSADYSTAGSEQESSEDYWATKPPILGGTEGEENTEENMIAWLEDNLDGYDLSPPQDTDSSLPPGESLCAFQATPFVLEHPWAQAGSGFRNSVNWLNRFDSELFLDPIDAYDLAPQPIAHLDIIDQSNEDLETTSRQESKDLPNIVLPSHVNNLPLYERARLWENPRCYQLSDFQTPSTSPQLEGVLLNEAEAYAMYQRLVRTTLWRELDQSPGRRNVIGIRGAYPGSLNWHYNAANQYNDTIVLLWKDEQGLAHVKEYPVNTDTGVYDFGTDNSSSLRANRHYPYINGWHRDYNALQIALPSYPVRDDTNNNGHWDSDRNGWLEGNADGQDYNRLGTAHNIHAGNASGLLEEVLINIASAGCQVIPGMENWIDFIGHAWTNLGDEVDYYLIDARDISPRFWQNCESNGTHACPHLIQEFPYRHQANTGLSQERWYDDYNCSDTNESGPEVVYVTNLPRSGRLQIEVRTSGEHIDPDIYLLEGDDRKACHSRDHRLIETWLPPGRYVIIVDTWVDGNNNEKVGEYSLEVNWSPDP